MDKKFVGFVKQDATVSKVTNSSVTVVYKDKTKETFTFKEWTSKEESNASYLHKLRTDLKEKDKLKEGDIVYYDPGFFEPDMFDKRKVFYRANINVTTAWMEVQETFEDAVMLSNDISTATTVSQIKIRDLVLDKADEITEVADIKKHISPNTSLFTLVSNVINNDKLDKATMDLLQSFIKVSPKAKYDGTLLKVKVFYNCEYKELSKSLRKLVDISAPYMINDSTGKKYSGEVNGGYSINGVPLDLGKLHIKFYIDVNSGLGPGDKVVFANQLKSTLTSSYDYPIVCEDGTKIDALFSFKGQLARIILNASLAGTLGTCMDKLSDNAVDMYFN